MNLDLPERLLAARRAGERKLPLDTQRLLREAEGELLNWRRWSGGQFPDESRGDVIAYEADGTIVLDDGVTTWNPLRALAAAVRDRESVRKDESAPPSELWQALLEEYKAQIAALTSRLIQQRRELAAANDRNRRGNEFAAKAAVSAHEGVIVLAHRELDRLGAPPMAEEFDSLAARISRAFHAERRKREEGEGALKDMAFNSPQGRAPEWFQRRAVEALDAVQKMLPREHARQVGVSQFVSEPSDGPKHVAEFDRDEALWGEDAEAVRVALDALSGLHPERRRQEREQAAFAVVRALKKLRGPVERGWVVARTSDGKVVSPSGEQPPVREPGDFPGAPVT